MKKMNLNEEIKRTLTLMGVIKESSEEALSKLKSISVPPGGGIFSRLFSKLIPAEQEAVYISIEQKLGKALAGTERSWAGLVGKISSGEYTEKELLEILSIVLKKSKPKTYIQEFISAIESAAPDLKDALTQAAKVETDLDDIMALPNMSTLKSLPEEVLEEFTSKCGFKKISTESLEGWMDNVDFEQMFPDLFAKSKKFKGLAGFFGFLENEAEIAKLKTEFTTLYKDKNLNALQSEFLKMASDAQTTVNANKILNGEEKGILNKTISGIKSIFEGIGSKDAKKVALRQGIKKTLKYGCVVYVIYKLYSLTMKKELGGKVVDITGGNIKSGYKAGEKLVKGDSTNTSSGTSNTTSLVADEAEFKDWYTTKNSSGINTSIYTITVSGPNVTVSGDGNTFKFIKTGPKTYDLE